MNLKRLKLYMAWIGKNLENALFIFFIGLIVFIALGVVGIMVGEIGHMRLSLAIFYVHLWAAILAAIIYCGYKWYSWGKDNYAVINSEVDLEKAKENTGQLPKASNVSNVSKVTNPPVYAPLALPFTQGSFHFPFNRLGEVAEYNPPNTPLDVVSSMNNLPPDDDPVTAANDYADEIEMRDSITETEEHYKQLVSALEKERNQACRVIEQYRVSYSKIEETCNKLIKENENLQQKLLEAQSHSDNAIADLE